ncbi:unnamed protein product [Didymodactylos carnosus]|uniref:Uncharacterized protein n=1 Tax=Didymodactylos carnosus TaxID=1234261 RepID=A0A815XS07_9BILA|nr:unnamed protein product [Didymodactylos carnosus]CAF4422278.1 unnamed protein product [Didymodactylos carnosus]
MLCHVLESCHKKEDHSQGYCASILTAMVQEYIQGYCADPSQGYYAESTQDIWGGQFHIHQIVMVYDQKCTIVPGIDFLQATILEIQYSHEPQRCLVKLNYEQTELYVDSSAIFQMPFQGLEDDDMDHDKLACLKHELYVDPFDSRYTASEADEEEGFSKTNSQSITSVITPATVRKHYFHGQHMCDLGCYLQNKSQRFIESVTKRIQSNTEKTLKKEKTNSSFEEQLPVFDREEIMWPEDGEVWFYHEIKRQRQQFIRSKPSHSHDDDMVESIGK